MIRKNSVAVEQPARGQKNQVGGNGPAAFRFLDIDSLHFNNRINRMKRDFDVGACKWIENMAANFRVAELDYRIINHVIHQKNRASLVQRDVANIIVHLRRVDRTLEESHFPALVGVIKKEIIIARHALVRRP